MTVFVLSETLTTVSCDTIVWREDPLLSFREFTEIPTELPYNLEKTDAVFDV